MGESATLQGVYLTDFCFRRQAINKWLLSLLDCSLETQERVEEQRSRLRATRIWVVVQAIGKGAGPGAAPRQCAVGSIPCWRERSSRRTPT